MDFRIRIFLLSVLNGLFHLSGSAQSNLVFVEPVYESFTFTATFNTEVNIATLNIPDSSVYKITSAGCYRNSPLGAAPQSLSFSYRVADIAVIVNEVVNADNFHQNYSNDMNIWINEGNHAITFFQNGTPGNIPIKCWLSGVQYKKVPIE